jgi:FHS family Na+ dependent glucose MFS transporter 1
MKEAGIAPFVAYASVLAAVGLMAGALGPSLPTLAAQVGVTLSGVSLVLALRPVGYLLGVQVAGRVFDRIRGHRVMAGALLLASAAFALATRMPTLGLLCAVIFLLGVADGVLDVGCNTLLPWTYGDKVGPYMNGLHFCFGVGALAAPLLIAQSLGRGRGVELAFWIMAALMLPLIPMLLQLRSPTRPAQDVEGAGSRVAVLTALLVGTVFFAYGGAEASFGSWLYSYALKSGLADEQAAARLTALFWAALSSGRLAGVFIARWVPLGAVLAGDALLCLLSLGAMLIWPGSSHALWWGSLGAGLGMASFFPTLLAWSSKRLAPDGRISGALTAAFFTGSASGTILLPWAIGQGFESRGPIFSIQVVFAAALAMAVALSALLIKRERHA